MTIDDDRFLCQNTHRSPFGVGILIQLWNKNACYIKKRAIVTTNQCSCIGDIRRCTTKSFFKPTYDIILRIIPSSTTWTQNHIQHWDVVHLYNYNILVEIETSCAYTTAGNKDKAINIYEQNFHTSHSLEIRRTIHIETKYQLQTNLGKNPVNKHTRRSYFAHHLYGFDAQRFFCWSVWMITIIINTCFIVWHSMIKCSWLDLLTDQLIESRR